MNLKHEFLLIFVTRGCINLTDEKLIEHIIKTKHVSHNRTQVNNLISHIIVLAEIVVNRSSVDFIDFLRVIMASSGLCLQAQIVMPQSNFSFN